MPAALPIDPHLPSIVEAVRDRRAAVVVAPPGAGKTTRVPPALLSLGPLILLQPRRVAARSLARRIAAEQSFELGREVGWQVRGERRFGKQTQLLVATEGVLTARLTSDPLLSDFATVVLDEVHERSLHTDLALALAREALRARTDLHLVVMSATMDAARVRAYLDGCPLVEVEGRPHPVEIRYAELTMADAVTDVLSRPAGEPGQVGHILCFLPGAGDIRRCHDELARRALPGNPLLLPLHGSLSANEQDAALAPSARRKVILATNIAETSLTVDGVTDVVDSGLEKVPRYDPARGLDRLELERISQSSAAQRAGRAGRTAPGRALRLWDARLAMRPERDPEIARADLAPPFLDVFAWGGDPATLTWLDAPPPAHAAAAIALLERLGALRGGRLTESGERMRHFPLPPRLAAFLLVAGGGPRACAAAALLAERDFLRGPLPTTTSDLLVRVDRIHEAPPGLRAAARQIEQTARSVLTPRPAGDVEIERALLAGYPDRVARRREPGSAKLLLSSGRGAVLTEESGVREAELLIALDLAGDTEPRVRMASRVERAWLVADGASIEQAFDPAAGRVRAARVERYGAIELGRAAMAPDPDVAADLLARELLRRGLGEDDERLRRRLAVAGIVIDVEAAVRDACTGRTRLPTLSLSDHLPYATRRRLDRLAPDTVTIPSGRAARLEYRADGSVVLSAKLQELFGLSDAPRIGAAGEPVIVEPLAPNGRPLQATRDLRSFWDRTYHEVRRELRGRYPKHPWPEDPWSAAATARTRRRDRDG